MLRIKLPWLGVDSKVGVNARAGQYLAQYTNDLGNLRVLDKSETVNAMRGRYHPHQGARERQRRVSQIARGMLQVSP